MVSKNSRAQQSRTLPVLLLLGTLVALGSLTFVAPASSGRQTLTIRSSGFKDGKASEPKVKAALSVEQLQEDHGEKWEMVDKILKGKKAKSPEAMMRARFTGLKYKDPQFLAATEKDPSEETTIKKRAEGWKITLGLEKAPELSFWDKLFGEGEAVQSMQEPISFELIEADEDEVEFKMNFADGMTLHERSTFNEDRKWGYVFSGESEFADWFETPKK